MSKGDANMPNEARWRTIQSHKVLLTPDGVIIGGDVPKAWQGHKLSDVPWQKLTTSQEKPSTQAERAASECKRLELTPYNLKPINDITRAFEFGRKMIRADATGTYAGTWFTDGGAIIVRLKPAEVDKLEAACTRNNSPIIVSEGDPNGERYIHVDGGPVKHTLEYINTLPNRDDEKVSANPIGMIEGKGRIRTKDYQAPVAVFLGSNFTFALNARYFAYLQWRKVNILRVKTPENAITAWNGKDLVSIVMPIIMDRLQPRKPEPKRSGIAYNLSDPVGRKLAEKADRERGK
jgi:hypothetical protein